MSRTLWLVVFLLPCVHAAEPVKVEQIDAVVSAELKKQKTPGAAVAVIHKGKEVVAKGYGLANVEHDVAVTADTIFQTGSVGKQFTAAVIMLLAEKKKLTLDDPLTTFYPDAARWGKVTVRHLLTHTAGMPDYTDQLDLRKDYTEDDLAKLALAQKPAFAPGEKWAYSNTGYVLLGCIAKKASGRFYGNTLKDDVFAPLGMKTARVISEADIVPHRAASYQLEKRKLRNQEWVSPSLNTTADGALYVTIRDMVAWDKGIRDGAILTADSWKQVFTPVKLTGGKTAGYGFGWAINEDNGQPHHQHGGAWQGFTTHISRYRGDDLSVVVLTNLAGCDPGTISEQIAGLFNPKLGPKPAK